MSRILVGTDGTAPATVAVRWAAGAAAALDAELIVATVIPHGTDEAHVHEAHRALHTRWSAPASAGGQPFRSLVLHGDPRQMLHDVSESEQVILTVLGTTGEGWYPALHLGSTGHHIAEHVTRPLAIIPPGTGSFHVDHIVLGVDGSPGSLAAVAWCCELAARTKASVQVVHAHQPGARAGTSTDPADWRDEAERHCREWAGPLQVLGHLGSVVVVDDDPARAIHGRADDADADLVVIGSRGTGGFHGLRLGSVALKLLHHATRPTVIVPPPQPS